MPHSHVDVGSGKTESHTGSETSMLYIRSLHVCISIRTNYHHTNLLQKNYENNN